jgi:DNA primase
MGKYSAYIREHLDVRSEDGNEHYALCPFHEDRTASFAVNGDSGLFVCYACGASGRFEALVKRLGEEFFPKPRKVGDVLKTFNEMITRGDVEELHGHKPERWLDMFGINHRSEAFWQKRGISQKTQRDWQLGYDNRLKCYTIALRDSAGRVLGVVRRQDEDFPWHWSSKYMNPKGFQRKLNLFGVWAVKPGRPLAIVEGPADALACWNVGQQAVALFGASLSAHQRQLVIKSAPSSLLIATDNDKAGRDVAEQIKDALGRIYPTTRVSFGDAKDPGDLRPSQLKRALALSAQSASWSK